MFTIIFLCGDGVRMLEAVTKTLDEPPLALAYIRPGLAFGGNRDTFPGELDEAIVRHPGIKYLAYDWRMSPRR
jgi:hypothetical protein